MTYVNTKLVKTASSRTKVRRDHSLLGTDTGTVRLLGFFQNLTSNLVDNHFTFEMIIFLYSLVV